MRRPAIQPPETRRRIAHRRIAANVMTQSNNPSEYHEGYHNYVTLLTPPLCHVTATSRPTAAPFNTPARPHAMPRPAPGGRETINRRAHDERVEDEADPRDDKLHATYHFY